MFSHNAAKIEALMKATCRATKMKLRSMWDKSFYLNCHYWIEDMAGMRRSSVVHSGKFNRILNIQVGRFINGEHGRDRAVGE